MIQADFESKMSQIMAQEKNLGVKIHITDLIDKDHLDCTWYGGSVGNIEYNGYTIVIAAYGDIRLFGQINGEIIDIKDKNNGGSVYTELGSSVDDDMLHELLCGQREGNDYLVFENNNWFEVDLISPDGEYIDLCNADNILEDNLLDCFAKVDSYFEYIEWAKEEHNG